MTRVWSRHSSTPQPSRQARRNTVTFEGNAVTYDTTVPNDTACCNLASHRAITDIVTDGGNDMVYDFDIMEGNGGNIDATRLWLSVKTPTCRSINRHSRRLCRRGRRHDNDQLADRLNPRSLASASGALASAAV